MTSLMEAVAGATADVPRVYALGSVPAQPDVGEYPYSSVSASLGEGATRLMDVSEGLRRGRIVTQTFGLNLDAALDHAEDIRAALVGIRLPLDGGSCSPIVTELAPAVTRDADNEGVIAVTATYTFTKEQP